ncbi:MAG TPA: hypothetical protein VIY08_02220 [Candidatus Nitrosocosmicus sp.]
MSIKVLLNGFYENKGVKKKVLVEHENKNNIDNLELDVWSLYLFALKSPVTRDKYKTRLEKFFNYIIFIHTLNIEYN